MSQKQRSPAPPQQPGNDKKRKHCSSITAQQKRLLIALQTPIQPVTTLYARERLDVMHPAARIQELREQGHNIITHWSTETNAQGHEHRVARYALMTSKENAA